MAMNSLKKEMEHFESRDDIKPTMLRVFCPLRAGCPNFWKIKPREKKPRCYGRLFDLADTNGVVWLRYRCQRTKQVMVMKQMGSKLLGGDSGDDPKEQLPDVSKNFQQIRCPVCGQWILDVYQEAGEFLFEFKCPTHRNIVSWCEASRGQPVDNEENADCA